MKLMDVIPGDALLRFAKILAVLGIVYFVVHRPGFQRLFASDTEGLGALLQIVGTLYSVLYAFATYVIWGQFTAVESQILKEAGALKDLIIFSTPLKAATREPIVQAVKVYAKAVADTEWRALSRNEPTDKTDRSFLQVVSAVTSAKPEDDTERTLYARLLEITDQASAHRDERLALSVKRIPRTLLVFVNLMALVILLLLFLYPFQNIVLGLLAIAITALLLFVAHFVVTDLDNPFEGAWNVNPEAFAELVTKFR